VAEAIEFSVGKVRNLENDILRLTEESTEKGKEDQSLTEKVGKLDDDFRTRENQFAEANRELRCKANEVTEKSERILTLEKQVAEVGVGPQKRQR
jgi:hypothetical protein